MKPLKSRVLEMFTKMNKDVLDLHVLFEAGGNDPAERERVLDALKELVSEGLLESRGSDFYTLTAQGKRQAASA
jgi:DNA-binding PadR family transcriptional regulator